ncbi:MAG: ABC transporter ATP-binding protein [Muribaculaceae bacterium]|nr:ABC transporter ATP-binding protein [Muribaculaceae bacterium]
MISAPAISVNAISKSYGAVEALRSLSLSVNPGELFGLIGPDGAGKSSLYRILATLAAPDAGSATIAGLDVCACPGDVRRCIGYMPERFSLYPDMTVRENLEFFASLFGVGISESRDLIAPFFSRLEPFSDRLAGALSGGMKQKLALSCALIHRPEVLLLDEPTTGVDAVSRSEFWEVLVQLCRSGMTVLVTTSYMDEAMLCDRVAMINRGEIMCCGAPEALLAHAAEGLYAVTATDMYALLGQLRRLPDVADCYTFGASVHLVASPGFDAVDALAALRMAGLEGVAIEPVSPTLEDVFIKLMKQ